MQFRFFGHHNSKLNTLRYFVLLLFLPVLSTAQTNEDYIRLVRKADTSRTVFALPGSSVNRDVKKVKGDIRGLNYWNDTKRVRVINNQYVLQNNVRTLVFGGTFNTSTELSWANRLPALQKEYAQGINNTYMGPETGTLFSYGPSISTLEFDGTNYVYDKNGRLVPKGTGNGQAAKAYDNGILRNGVALNNDLLLRATYVPMTGRPWTLELKAGQENTKSIIRQNDNLRQKWGVSLQHKGDRQRVTFSYDKVTDHFDFSNRAGFLNRVYQYSLLTPVSFENAQGTMIGTRQRSYSSSADNPLFLLQDRDNDYGRYSHNASIKFEANTGQFSFNIIPTFQSEKTKSMEAYAAGSTGFPDGIKVQRQQNDYRLLTRGYVKYEMPRKLDGKLRTSAELNYNYSNLHTDIRYRDLQPEYSYKRVTHEPYLSLYSAYETNIWTFILSLNNKSYLSNTVDKPKYFLPSGTFCIVKSFRSTPLWIRYRSYFNQWNRELPIQSSQAIINLQNYTITTLSSFLPVTEVNQYHLSQPVYQGDWDNEVDVNFDHFTLMLTYFRRQTNNDIVPVVSNNSIQLQSIASHMNKGLEVSLSHSDFIFLSGKLRFNNNLSFTTNRTQITTVKEGYNYTPTAGLRDVHTALVAGAPSNVIVGTSYLRDANHQIVTGADGEPLIDPKLKVIGDPNPDFMMSITNYFSYGIFAISTSLQWKKGGEKYNGTAALLDFYGRSASSAIQRKTDNTQRAIVAEKYIQRADFVRLNNISLSMKPKIRGVLNKLNLTAYVRNILLWTPYKGVEPDQSLLDQGYTTALDLFNLPATTTAGFEAIISF